jgi:hypothetical protein
MTEEKKSYYAIIPSNVRYDENLTPNAKLLYGEITALCNERGYCWASNSYFAKLYKVSNTSISLWIKQLKDNGYIEVQQNYKEGTKEILNRYLSILKGGTKEILNTPPQENLKDNNTLINNTINNTSNKEKPAKQKADYSDSFNIFYELYNHPVNKQPAFKEWKKIDPELHQEIYNHIREYRSRGQGVDFPLNPNNYLKNKRWTEMIVEKGKQEPPKPTIDESLEYFENLGRELGYES